MAIYTRLGLDDARALGQRFGLDIVAHAGVAAGSVNTGYALTSSAGDRFYARIYEHQGLEGAERDTRLSAHLSDHDVPTPRPLALVDGPGFVTEILGKPAALFPWVRGHAVPQRGVTQEHLEAVGAALARVHIAGLSLSNTWESRFRAEDLSTRLSSMRADPSLPEPIARLLPELEDRLHAQRAAKPFSVLPLVHNDLFRDNVLFEDGALVALLDFESASMGSAAFDLMVTMLAWCFGDDLDLRLGQALLRGYQAKRSLLDAEREELYDAARFAALRFLITRITDFELRKQGEGVRKDYRRFLARLRALEALDERSLRAALRV